jgi:hypothetical protein
MVFAYLLGSIIGGISAWWNRRRRGPRSGTWGDIKALVVLVTILIVAGVNLLEGAPQLDPVVERIALGLTLFYFGSR